MIRLAFCVESTLDNDTEWAERGDTFELDFVYAPTVAEVAYHIERTLLALEP